MDRTAIKAFVRLILNQPNTPTNKSLQDADLNIYVNEAQRDLQNAIVEASEDFFATTSNIAVITGTETYALPTDLLKISAVERVDGSNFIPIEPINYTQKEEYRPTTIGTSDIDYYYIFGTNIGFIPAVTNTVRLSYIQRLADISDETTVSSIPLQYHKLLCLSVARMATLQLMQKREDIEAMYQAELIEMKRQIENRIEHRAKYVYVTPK